MCPWQPGELCEGDLFAEIHEGSHRFLEGVGAVLFGQLLEPVRADAHRSDRCPHIALQNLGHS